MLKKKTCIITGGTGGIGLAIAEKFANNGAQLLLTDTDSEKLAQSSEKIGASYIPADLTSAADCKAIVDRAIDEFGSLDILVNVAGIQTVSSIEDFPEEKWKLMIDLMLTAPFLLTKYSWPHMKSQNFGRIININSIHGLVASPFKSAYVSAKHGLSGLTKTAALEGGEFGITVNSICPAYVKTPLVEKQIADQAIKHGIPAQSVIEDIMLKNSAVKALIEPSVIGDVALFLCSEAGKHITGSLLTVDGAWTAQ